MQTIKEATTQIIAPVQKVVDRKMPVFYNPVMKLNRDFSVMAINAIKKTGLKIGLPLAGSGIRAIRLIKETQPKKIESIYVNDKKENYKEYFEKNIEINEFSDEEKNKLSIFNEDANSFMMQNKPFDYLDIDPFGTPNPFLDSAVRAIRSEGILAVTATDTSALCGSYPKACKRKYWAEPLRNELMHEIGLRILIRKVQLVSAQYDIALIPVCSYSMDHYMKVFFKAEKGKQSVDSIMSMHKEYLSEGKVYGPIFMGALNDLVFLKEMRKYADENIDTRSVKLLDTLIVETELGGFGFYDAHKIAKRNKISIPKFEHIFSELKKKGYKATRTHFTDTGIKTDAALEDIENIMKNSN